MADVWAVALFVVGFIVMLTSMMVWTAYLLPRHVARAQRQIETQPWQSFFVGLAVLALGLGTYFFALSLRKMLTAQFERLFEMLANYAGISRYSGDAGTVAHDMLWIVTIPFFIAIVIGAAAFARLFAQRADIQSVKPLKSLIGGAFTLSCSVFLPLVGWFVFLPIVGAMSAGAGMTSLLTRDPKPTN